MSTSKFAGLEGVDFDSPDVYEAGSPSPKGKSRGLGGRLYDSSDDDSEVEHDTRSGLGSRHRKVGQGGAGAGRRLGAGAASDRQLLDNDNEGIVRVHLDAEAAAAKFQQATGVDSKEVDFSTSIHKASRKAHYYPRPTASFDTPTYILGSGRGYRPTEDLDQGRDGSPWQRDTTQPESALDRFRRLRFEMEELEREVKQGGALDSQGNKDVGTMGGLTKATSSDGATIDGLLPQIHSLRQSLNGLEGSIDQLDPVNGETARWQAQTRQLLQRLAKEGQSSTSDGSNTVQASNSRADQAAENAKAGGAQLAHLDERLAGLESLMGVQEAAKEDGNALPRPLLPSLARIEHLLTLLTQPRHLDAISRRIKVLVSELERVHETRKKLISAADQGDETALAALEGSGGPDKNANASTARLPMETLKKLDTVLPILAKVEPLLPIVPTLLTRLQTLSSLHASSASFAHDVETLDGLVRTSQSQTQELRDMLANVQTSLVENETRTQANMQFVEQRMDSIAKRIEALSSRA